MPAITPLKEVTDIIKEAGGEELKLCYQCGLCTGVCPWNKVRSFLVRRIMHQAQLGVVDFEDEDMWLCVTCRACVERCPRGVNIIDVMKALRRGITEMGIAKVPDSLRVTLKNISATGNPLGEPAENRANWAKGLNVKEYTKGTEWLYFVGCMSAYDPKLHRIPRALVGLFQKAGLDFGILGNRETCAGESVRKTGDEQLFQTLAQTNIDTFRELGVKRIVTTSPHEYHTIKNEYPALGGQFEVVHYTQLLDQLIKDGKLKPTRELKKKVVYHDPCYLGRHNGVYDQPREALRSIPGLELVEMPHLRANSLCCGGGGGGIWRETKKEERFSNIRLEEALQTGASVLAVACPYCASMFDDSVLSQNKGDAIQVKDIAELLQEAV
ncbi:MAG: (Fe-S)-binding protein, partial [Dehalococcoidales bacterium]|nr:(Fe-S)-binding protein [Dehalococcoidales bacterium]